jgi:4-hydroxy-3-polyprenylbenzoate decarboxylase
MPVELGPRFLVAVTGASGVEYARRLIEVLGERTDVILTKDSRAVIEVETGLSAKEFAAGAGTLFSGEDLSAAPASGSHRFRALVIVPCSGTTLAKIAAGIADNLVTRAAAVALKERRPLVLVPRETPLSPIALENLLKLSRLGVVILPASPGFYGAPKHIADLVDFIVARILDQLGVEHSVGVRWTGPPE